MDGFAPVAPSPAEEQEALLEFLYLCPHGLVEFDDAGAVGMMNPACIRMLLPLLPAGCSQIDNILDALAPFAPDLRGRLADGGQARGLLLDAQPIHIGVRVAALAPSPRRKRAPQVEVLALTILRLRPGRHMGVLADITEQVAQQRKLRESEAWFNALADGADGYAFFGLDLDGGVADWNGGAERLFGLTEVQAVGRPGRLILGDGGHPAEFARRLARVRAEGWQVMDGWMPGPEGSRFWGTTVISAMHVEGGASHAFLAVVRDVTERRDAALALHQALNLDHLTNLLNRRHFFERGEAELRIAMRDRLPLAAIMVDADHFKAVNDRHGHAAGDVALRGIAELLRGLTRDGVDLVGRLGGEEFAVLLPGRDAAAAMLVAERLRAGIAETAIDIRGRNGGPLSLRLTASFGVACCDGPAAGGPGGSLEALLAAADGALYAAKEAGRDRVCAA